MCLRVLGTLFDVIGDTLSLALGLYELNIRQTDVQSSIVKSPVVPLVPMCVYPCHLCRKLLICQSETFGGKGRGCFCGCPSMFARQIQNKSSLVRVPF